MVFSERGHISLLCSCMYINLNMFWVKNQQVWECENVKDSWQWMTSHFWIWMTLFRRLVVKCGWDVAFKMKNDRSSKWQGGNSCHFEAHSSNSVNRTALKRCIFWKRTVLSSSRHRTHVWLCWRKWELSGWRKALYGSALGKAQSSKIISSVTCVFLERLFSLKKSFEEVWMLA